jgi:hypothetical protein
MNHLKWLRFACSCRSRHTNEWKKGEFELNSGFMKFTPEETQLPGMRDDVFYFSRTFKKSTQFAGKLEHAHTHMLGTSTCMCVCVCVCVCCLAVALVQ